MPYYQLRGNIPKKRHTQFRKESGDLYWEELLSRQGFSGDYSNVYHVHPPTAVTAVGDLLSIPLTKLSGPHRHRHLFTANCKPDPNHPLGRTPLLFNSDLIISKHHLESAPDCLIRNGHFDEMWYVQSGTGKLRTQFGRLDFKPGDYLVLPRGVIWELVPDGPLHLLVVESFGAVDTPERYRSEHGQLLEHAPFCERDFRTPEFFDPVDEKNVDVLSRLESGYQTYTYERHPFDLIGWDGCLYPWAFSIHDFEPVTGRIHQPPPVHQTFAGAGFVVCSFVPRLFDYHPESIPAPYAHSNVDSDEVLFYSAGNFMSRKGIVPESITLHPAGLPHGPQPGKAEASIGVKATEELAVMIDTFKPLNCTTACETVDDEQYPFSWLEEN